MRCVYVLEFYTTCGSHLIKRSFNLFSLLSSECIFTASSWCVYKGFIDGDNLFGLWSPSSLVARSAFYRVA